MRSSKKKTIALVSLVAACSSMFTIPANAASVVFEGNTCSFTFNKDEKEFSYLPFFNDINSQQASSYIDQISADNQRDKEKIKGLKQELKDGKWKAGLPPIKSDKPGDKKGDVKVETDEHGIKHVIYPIDPDKNREGISKEEYDRMVSMQEAQFKNDIASAEKAVTIRNGLLPALTACSKGQSYEDEPTPSKTPQKGADSALSTADGELNDAGIGVIVAAVLLLLGGAVAAVLPQLGLV